jgi:hypothetical protein
LHLIDDHWRLVAEEEALRLFFGLFGFGWEVERYELMLRKEPSKGGRLTGLAGAGQHYDWTGPCGP